MFYTENFEQLLFCEPKDFPYNRLLILSERLDEWGIGRLSSLPSNISVTVIYGKYPSNSWPTASAAEAASAFSDSTHIISCPSELNCRGNCYIWLKDDVPVRGLTGSYSLIRNQSCVFLNDVPEEDLPAMVAWLEEIAAAAPAAPQVSSRVHPEEDPFRTSAARSFERISYEVSGVFEMLTFTTADTSRHVLLSQLSLYADDLKELLPRLSSNSEAGALILRIEKQLKQEGWIPCASCGKLFPPDALKETERGLLCKPCRRKKV